MPVFIIVATLAVVGLLGFGNSEGINKRQVDQEVNALLAGVPQRGAALGSPQAPITVRVFADLECPTVKRFVVSYLPSLIDTWVRNGAVRLEYRSLETDTLNEHTFFRQEVAALAAGRQDKMWNFVFTFVQEQKPEYSGYATNAFLADIASQVPGLYRAQWRHDRKDARLTERVILGAQAAGAEDFRYTPSLQVSFTDSKVNRPLFSGDLTSLHNKFEASLAQIVASLRADTSADNPALHSAELEERKEVRELRGE